MLKIDDLIGVPYKDNGRTLDGLDCYGLAIEVEKRLGKNLRDVVYNDNDILLSQIYAPLLNIKKTNEYKLGNILEMTLLDRLHIGVCLSDRTFIHATSKGVRVTRIGVIPIKSVYEVV